MISFSTHNGSIMAIAFAAIISSMFICQGEDGDMSDLDVSLGFAKVPVDNTCVGLDVSPKIQIRGLNASSVAIIVDDPDAPSGTFTHWAIWNIEPSDIVPANIPNVPAPTTPIKAVQGANSFGRIGYIGPCPPRGSLHHYIFKVYGLDRMLDLSPGATKKDLEKAMSGHILQKGEAMATFQR
jgi:Raf kinase inhibitor-like YbhB/YbcL family protein